MTSYESVVALTGGSLGLVVLDAVVAFAAVAAVAAFAFAADVAASAL